jgi:hypothetical protein
MATRDDLRRLAAALPAVEIDAPAMHVSVDGKQLVWPWLERIDPKRARVPNPDVIAIRLASETDKEILIDMAPAVFFTEPHYDGYPAILVHLALVDPDLLSTLLANAWRARAPKRLLAEGPPPADGKRER